MLSKVGESVRLLEFLECNASIGPPAHEQLRRLLKLRSVRGLKVVGVVGGVGGT